jgi:hypothetical protein
MREIQDVLLFQCSGSITFDTDLEADPDPAPDPALFISGFRDANNKRFFYSSYFWLLFTVDELTSGNLFSVSYPEINRLADPDWES